MHLFKPDADRRRDKLPRPRARASAAALTALLWTAAAPPAAECQAPKGAEKKAPAPAGFACRSGPAKLILLHTYGGTGASEAAVARGLAWIARQQSADGGWRLDGNYPDKGQQNDIAGTAFGLLPLLAAGKTHKGAPENSHDKSIEKGLFFLIRKQDKKTGNFGGGMYAHPLAAIAMCEAYGMTQDQALRKPAQLAVNFIVSAQHEAGGWRYAPGQAGDTSVTGWHFMALQAGQMAGLKIPDVAFTKAARYLDSCCQRADEGYGYVPGAGVGGASTPTMSAVGLLCRQYGEKWGPQNDRLIKGIDNHVKPRMGANGPAIKNIYLYYYASQVMRHAGGDAWQDWNAKMRDFLVKTQISAENDPHFGSWSSVGDSYGSAGGRLMITSLNLLTLEVYYRYPPLAGGGGPGQ
jgi:hypothetical protein